MRVIGSRRHVANTSNVTIPFVDVVYEPAHLDELLQAANFLTLSVPHTPETEKMIGAKELSMLPRGAVIINIARGVIIDQPALIEALRSGQVGGAALDVTDPEPLPPGNPLWTMPNVLISPHSASTATSENRKIVELFCQNLKRYLKGETLLNKLDTIRLY